MHFTIHISDVSSEENSFNLYEAEKNNIKYKIILGFIPLYVL